MFIGSQSGINATCYLKMLRGTTPLYLHFPCFLTDCIVLSSSLLKINQMANLTLPAPTKASIRTLTIGASLLLVTASWFQKYV